jgi:protease I
MVLDEAFVWPTKEAFMNSTLQGKRVAVLVADGFEQEELTRPREALDTAGAKSQIVSPGRDKVRGWKHTEWGDAFPVDVALDTANPGDFDALLLPGGVMNPDKLRANPRAVQFVKHFWDAGKPIAAICHGPWMLVETGIARGRRLTSYPSIKTDLMNAGANWVDEPVVTDSGVVTSRRPDDIPAFNSKMVEEFAEGPHEHRESEASERQTAGRR